MHEISKQVLELLSKKQFKKAEQVLRQSIENDPDDHQLYHLYGLTAALDKKLPEALERYERAISLNPGVAEYHHNLAGIYKKLGEFDKADQHYLEAIEQKPDYAEAYYNHASIKSFTADDPAFSNIEALRKNKQISDEDLSFIGFAGGKMFNDIGQFDKSFEYYAIGNDAMGAEFDIDQHRAYIDSIIDTFSGEFFNSKTGTGSDNNMPIFVVGMPRSGTTLVEQILSSHVDVFGAGELSDITAISNTMARRVDTRYVYPQGIKHLTDDVYAGYANAYIKRLRSFDGSAKRIVDKMPDNYLRLGLIALMLPEAKIIHCKRDPLDTCLSCYFQRFNKSHAYSFDLTSLGLYYREYERLMQHWETTLPADIYHLDYAELVMDQEKTSRDLLEFCELKWDAQCLDFYQTSRPVYTASSWQVRNPIDKNRLNRWRDYEAHLDPLQAALGQECEM